MKHDDLILRYETAERVNHWLVAITFVLLALSGLALFHPSMFFFTHLFGGGTWARILHPFIGLVMFVAFVALAIRFWPDNRMDANDKQWFKQWQDVIANREENLPPVGRYNAAQKALFWVMVACMILLLVTACDHRRGADPRHHRAHLRGHLGQGQRPRHDARLRVTRLGEKAPPGVVQASRRRWQRRAA
jgi:thiosulfate reductase cytochrome b subunit